MKVQVHGRLGPGPRPGPRRAGRRPRPPPRRRRRRPPGAPRPAARPPWPAAVKAWSSPADDQARGRPPRGGGARPSSARLRISSERVTSGPRRRRRPRGTRPHRRTPAAPPRSSRASSTRTQKPWTGLDVAPATRTRGRRASWTPRPSSGSRPRGTPVSPLTVRRIRAGGWRGTPRGSARRSQRSAAGGSVGGRSTGGRLSPPPSGRGGPRRPRSRRGTGSRPRGGPRAGRGSAPGASTSSASAASGSAMRWKSTPSGSWPVAPMHRGPQVVEADLGGAAVGVVHDRDPVDAELVDGLDQGADDVVGDPCPGVAQHVGVALDQAERLVGVDPGVHAGEHGECRHGAGRRGGRASKPLDVAGVGGQDRSSKGGHRAAH